MCHVFCRGKIREGKKKIKELVKVVQCDMPRRLMVSSSGPLDPLLPCDVHLNFTWELKV